MIRISNVSLSFGDKKIIDNLTFTFDSGKKYALMGESGIGKSTILGIISGTLKEYSGKVTTRSEKIAYAFQDSRLFPWLTVFENVLIVASEKNSCSLARAKEILCNLGLSDSMEKYPNELSGGMKQRVSLARALMYEGDILLLDEPFRALDEATAKQVAEYVFSVAKNKTVIFVTHDKTDTKYADVVLLADTSPVSELRMVKSSSITTE